MLETIMLDGIELVAGIPPSKHAAVKCRIVQPTKFHGRVKFVALFLDSVVRQHGARGGEFSFTMPRRRAFACAAMLYAVRNELLAHQGSLQLDIDNVHARVELRSHLGGVPEWFRVFLHADGEPIIDGLEIHGLDSFDDFCSGFLEFFGATP